MKVSFHIELVRSAKKDRMEYAKADVVRVKTPHRRQIEVKDFNDSLKNRIKRPYTKRKK